MYKDETLRPAFSNTCALSCAYVAFASATVGWSSSQSIVKKISSSGFSPAVALSTNADISLSSPYNTGNQDFIYNDNSYFLHIAFAICS